MDKKIIFLDLDGTLIMHSPNGNFIPNSAQRALQKAKENGHLIYLCTGRSFSMIDDYLKESELVDGIIGASGACIMMNKEIVYHKPYSLEEINELINILESNNIFHWLETNKGVYMNIEKYGNEVLKRRQFFPKFLESVKPKNEECLSIINKVSYIDPLNPLSFEEKLLSGKFILVPMSYDGQGENRGEISAIGTTKGTAIRYVLNKLNIPKKNAYCFGDSNNDLSMFPEVGTSICMGNGKDEVKKHASFVTKNIDDGGIEFGFKNFGLI